MMTEGAVIPQEKFYSALLEHHRVECDETTARQVASKIPVEIMERIVEMYGGASGVCVIRQLAHDLGTPPPHTHTVIHQPEGGPSLARRCPGPSPASPPAPWGALYLHNRMSHFPGGHVPAMDDSSLAAMDDSSLAAMAGPSLCRPSSVLRQSEIQLNKHRLRKLQGPRHAAALDHAPRSPPCPLPATARPLARPGAPAAAGWLTRVACACVLLRGLCRSVGLAGRGGCPRAASTPTMPGPPSTTLWPRDGSTTAPSRP